MQKEDNCDSKKYVVYKHTNKINGKVYIGQTCNVAERWRSGGKNYFGSVRFFSAIKKYGWENFTHEVLYSNLNKEAADILEIELIQKYNSIENGYNLAAGGHSPLTEYSLKKMSDSLRRGYLEHPERKEKIRKSRLGKKAAYDPKRKRGLYTSNSVLITIDGETGSIRYWASRIGMTHPPLIRWLRISGIEGLELFIRERLPENLLF